MIALKINSIKNKDGILKMGKGQRAREQRAQNQTVNPQKKNSSKKKKGGNNGWVSTLVVVLAIVLVVGIFVANYITNSGILLRSKTVMKTDNFEVNGTVMKYATMTSYQSYVNTLGDLVEQIGLDTSKPLASQPYGEEGKTWLDYFKDTAKAQLSEILVYAEAAKAAGVELDSDELAGIKENIDSLDTTAVTAGYYSADAYIKAVYGSGVNKKDIRDFMELSTLASKYERQISEDAEKAVTDEELDAYYKEHIEDYAVADIISYTENLTLAADLTADEKAAKKAEFLAKFDTMKAATSEEEFKTNLLNYLTAKAEEDGTLGDEEALSPEDKLTSCYKTIGNGDINNADADSWLFELADSAFVRNAGEVELFTSDDNDDSTDETENEAEDEAEDTSADTEASEPEDTAEAAEDEDLTINASDLLGDTEAAKDITFTAEIYFIVKAPYANEKATKNVGHILLSFNAYGSNEAAKAAADGVYAEYLAGDKTKESFEALANKYTSDGSVFYENVKEGDMVETYNDWIYDETRKAGDTDIVESEFGYHIMYFVGDGYPLWKADCLTTITSEKAADMFEEYQAKYVVTVDEKAMAQVKG